MIVKQVLNFYLGNTKIYTSPKNFNSELGLVFSIFRIEQYTPGILSLLKKCFQIWKMSYFEPHNYDVLFLEYGVDHPGDMDFLLSIAKPDIAIFTKLDKIHSVYFETPNGIGDEKIKLLQQAKKRVYVNKSDTFSKSIFEDLKIKKKAFFSQARGIQFIKEKQKVYSEFFYGSKRIQTNLKGKENLDYMTLGFDILQDEFKKEIHDVKIKIKMQPGRMTFLEGINDSVLIDSSYNAGPESMKAMIANSFDFQKKLYPDYKVILVL